ncbi:hypothetical protein CAP35_09670 [Chitinophagaceae bacterium IBVUCB1]|nr:hypothetical protein CAP35_09670 [Chitinophagaceae bacterium IBVUCB1]
MRKVILPVLLMIISLSAKAGYLVQLNFAYNLWEGHWLTMYYSANNLHDLYSRLQTIDTITERKILAAIGTPLHERNQSEENCVVPNSIKVNYEKLFNKQSVRKVTHQTKEIFLEIKILNCDYQLCTFPLTNKYWGSYDVSFKEAGVIISEIEYNNWTNDDRYILKKISKTIENIHLPVLSRY